MCFIEHHEKWTICPQIVEVQIIFGFSFNLKSFDEHIWCHSESEGTTKQVVMI